jgi:uncharacterized protein YfdQ (DUF2303 family)
MTETPTAQLGSVELSSISENAVVADLARRAVAPERFDIIKDRLVGVVVDGALTTYEVEQYGPQPHRQTGRVTLTDQDSFALYVNRHRDDDRTTLWTNVDAGTVTAVINDHRQDDSEAGWADHRAVLQLKLTDDWKFWAANDGKLLNQTAFAEHIEEGALNVVDPAAADMLEIAQSFQAKRGVAFKSSVRLESGEVGLQYEETTQAKVGVKGTIDIPSSFTLKLQPFAGGPEYTDIVARFRYRINDGQLALGYKINRPDLVKRAAFNEITSAVSEGIALPVMAGTPRS